MFINFIKHFKPFLIVLMFLTVLVWGTSFLTLPKEASPAIDVPFFTVTTVYPWADPETIEKQVVEKLESSFTSISWVKWVDSISSYNVGVISVEFDRKANAVTAYNDLASAVDKVKTDFPDIVKDPVLKKTDVTDSPIFTFSIAWDYLPSILYDKLEFLENKLRWISWVSDVVVIWAYTPEIKVKFDYDKLLQYKVNFSTAINTITTYLDKFPADKKDINWSLYTLTLRTYSKDINEIWDFLEKMDLVSVDWKTIILWDVANVIVWPHQYKKESFIVNEENSYSTVTYQIKKVPWTDIIQTIKETKNILYNDTFFKDNELSIFEVDSQQEKIDSMYQTFVWNFRQTTLIIFIIILLFIGLKESIWISIVFPLVYFLAFIWLNQIWYTFNNIVSFSLVLTLWIMVDNLIVIIEWFEEWLKKWYDKRKAIDFSIKTYWKPLISWNLTTISMFIPIGFMLSGKIGDFMKYMPVTVNIVLVFSTFVALIFLPVVLTSLKFKVKKEEERHLVFNFLKWFLLKTIKHFKLTVLFFILLFVFSIFIVKNFVKTDFLPPVDTNNIYVNMTFDESTTLSENKIISSNVSSRVLDYFSENKWNLKFISTNIWDFRSTDPLAWVIYSNSFSPDVSYLNIRLTNTEFRDWDNISFNIVPKLKSFLNEYNFSNKLKTIEVFIQKSWPSKWKDINFLLEWNDLNNLIKFYTNIENNLNWIEWTYDWWSSLEYTNWKIEIIWDIEKLKQFNITSRELDVLIWSIQTSNIYEPAGITIKKLDDFSDELVDVKWFLTFNSWEENIKDSNESIMNIRIPWRDIYLRELVANITLLPEVKSIWHIDWKLVLNIWAYKTKETSLWNVTPKIEEFIELEKPNTPGVNFGYAWDVKDMQNSMKDLWKAFALWMMLMFSVLVLHFWNFRQPLLVMSVIPLLFIWAFLLLAIIWYPFSFPAQLWMFWLMWVWVNWAILLIESYNSLREKNKYTNHDTLLLEVIKSRLKPILLTTVTTILWLIILAIKDELWWSLSVAFMWWLMVWTFIILVYIPAMLRWWLYMKDNKKTD